MTTMRVLRRILRLALLETAVFAIPVGIGWMLLDRHTVRGAIGGLFLIAAGWGTGFRTGRWPLFAPKPAQQSAKAEALTAAARVIKNGVRS